MIYDFPKANEAIKQGDIFIYLPALHDIDLESLIVYDDQGNPTASNWKKLQKEKETQTMVIIEPMIGIVASQDCDTTRNDLISFFEIVPLITVTSIPKDRVKYFKAILDAPNTLTKWFYLPLDKKVGFTEQMAVDFERMFQVPRNGLEGNKDLRKGRLNDTAIEHYRKTMANYFTRYAYDKWYPLTKEELKEYNVLQSDGEKVTPFPWQK